MLDLDTLKRANPLDEVAQRLTGQVPVRHKICAPWRDERTPSLHIYEDGKWKDFGDGSHGDVIDFVGRYLFGSAYSPAAHFTDVVDYLGGLEIAPLRPSKQAAPRPVERPKLALSLADVERWHANLGEKRREWWYSRGVMDPAIDQFLLGWDGERYTIPHLYRGQVFGVKRRESEVKDYFAGTKYVAVKGSRPGLYNAEILRVENTVIVCEGEIDCILLNQYGFPAVSSTNGAGTFKPEWTRLFTSVPNIKILYDNDEAGRNGAALVKKHLRRARVVTLPGGIKDVGELVEDYDFPVTWLEANLR